MNDLADDRDDAAFRARLAPLASEVLPPPPAPLVQRKRWNIMVPAGIAVAVAVLGFAWLQSKWPWSEMPRAAIHAAPPAPDPSAEMVRLLMQRGDAAFAVGDIIAARLMYERAAGLGSANAATAAGKTYDMEFLLNAGARGIRADPAAAAAWYRRAAALGDPEAKTRLAGQKP